MNENNSNFTQTIFVRKHSQVPKENVRISNTKEGEAKGDKHIVRDLGRGGSQEKVRGSQANVRISNTKEDEAKGDLGLGTGRISPMPPQEKVRGSQANVRISNTKEDKAKGPKSQRKMSGSQMYVCM